MKCQKCGGEMIRPPETANSIPAMVCVDCGSSNHKVISVSWSYDELCKLVTEPVSK